MKLTKLLIILLLTSGEAWADKCRRQSSWNHTNYDVCEINDHTCVMLSHGHGSAISCFPTNAKAK